MGTARPRPPARLRGPVRRNVPGPQSCWTTSIAFPTYRLSVSVAVPSSKNRPAPSLPEIRFPAITSPEEGGPGREQPRPAGPDRADRLSADERAVLDPDRALAGDVHRGVAVPADLGVGSASGSPARPALSTNTPTPPPSVASAMVSRTAAPDNDHPRAVRRDDPGERVPRRRTAGAHELRAGDQNPGPSVSATASVAAVTSLSAWTASPHRRRLDAAPMGVLDPTSVRVAVAASTRIPIVPSRRRSPAARRGPRRPGRGSPRRRTQPRSARCRARRCRSTPATSRGRTPRRRTRGCRRAGGSMR